MGEFGVRSTMLAYVAHVERQGSKSHTPCDDSCQATCHHALMSRFSQRGVLTTQPNTFNYIITPIGKALFLTSITEITILKVYLLWVFQSQHAVYKTATICILFFQANHSLLILHLSFFFFFQLCPLQIAAPVSIVPVSKPRHVPAAHALLPVATCYNCP